MESLPTRGRYRPCVLGHVETRKLEPYYFMYPRLLNVLHKDTVYLKDGEIEQICLCKRSYQKCIRFLG